MKDLFLLLLVLLLLAGILVLVMYPEKLPVTFIPEVPRQSDTQSQSGSTSIPSEEPSELATLKSKLVGLNESIAQVQAEIREASATEKTLRIAAQKSQKQWQYDTKDRNYKPHYGNEWHPVSKPPSSSASRRVRLKYRFVLDDTSETVALREHVKQRRQLQSRLTDLQAQRRATISRISYLESHPANKPSASGN